MQRSSLQSFFDRNPDFKGSCNEIARLSDTCLIGTRDRGPLPDSVEGALGIAAQAWSEMKGFASGLRLENRGDAVASARLAAAVLAEARTTITDMLPHEISELVADQSAFGELECALVRGNMDTARDLFERLSPEDMDFAPRC